VEGIGEEGNFEVRTISYLLIPHNSKIILAHNP
jgi:hypothetical protein